MEATKVLKKKQKVLTPKLRFKDFIGAWNVDKLENKVNSISSGKIKPQEDGDYLVYGSTGVIGKSKEFSHEGDFLLVARVGANAGQINRVKGKYAVTDNTLVVDLKREVAIPFCEAFLLKFNLNKLIFGSGQPLITGGLLKAIDFIFPTLPEQQKIAAFLSTIDEKIQQLIRKKELLEQYKKGVMQQLFSGKLRFKDKNGKLYPKWEEKRLDEVANFRRGSFPQPYGLAKWFDDINGFPFVQVYDVDDNMLLKPNTKTKISKLAAEQSVFVKFGTLVITIQGSIGRIAKTQYDAYVDRTLLIFQSYKKPINVDYFKFVVSLLFEIEKTKAPGGTIKTITKEALSSFKIMLPSLEEQQKIGNYLSSIDNKIECINKQISQTQTFKKGLLQQMFV